jgi:hypothetical protein
LRGPLGRFFEIDDPRSRNLVLTASWVRGERDDIFTVKRSLASRRPAAPCCAIDGDSILIQGKRYATADLTRKFLDLRALQRSRDRGALARHQRAALTRLETELYSLLRPLMSLLGASPRVRDEVWEAVVPLPRTTRWR